MLEKPPYLEQNTKYMQRIELKFLEQWFQKKNRKPLIIRGARQVGKSTLVRLFAAEAGFELLEINLELHRLHALQNGQQLSSVKEVNQEIESLFNKKIHDKTLIFFDEIQQSPILISLLRYYYEEYPHLAVIAAGSLLEFVLEDHNFSMPVGRVEFLHLGPMKFSEFLLNSGKSELVQQVDKVFPYLKSHHFYQINEEWKRYLFVGGMPEAVKSYSLHQSPKLVRDIQRSIIQTYKSDFSKYASKKQLPRLETIFEALPQHLGRKIKYSAISSEFDSRKIKEAIQLLRLARIIHCCYHTNANGLPLSAQKDIHVYKIYFLDVGLLHYMQGLSWRDLKSYSDENLLTKGLSAEQFVAQHLAYSRGPQEEPELYYWLRDKTSEKAEVDFVFSREGSILPIEVKSGKSGKLKSLKQFISEKNISEAYRFDLRDRSQESPTSIEEKKVFLLHNWMLPLIEKLDQLPESEEF